MGGANITVADVVEACQRTGNSAMSHPFLFWLSFALRRHSDKEGKLGSSGGTIAGITRDSNPHFPFADAKATDVATCYFDFWFRCQCVFLPSPVNIVIGYIGLVAGIEKAIGSLQRVLEMDVTGTMSSEILGELAKRDAIPLAYRILALYTEDLSESTRSDIKLLLKKWLEFELASSSRRVDLIRQTLSLLA